jgi:peptidoglycan/LPS O-acetylase OafA/YrhL
MIAADSNFNRIEAAAGRYRPDIDGLRAVAVIAVVLYHFRVPPFTGGFVGVDVFFVISGFLITRLIWSEIGAGNFSFVNFYERRVRRILPALFAMLAVATIAAVVLLFPQMLVNYAMSLIATAGFVSNFHFFGATGYWAPTAAEQPLLHTWSLAVEEQFYLIFPLLLILFRGRSRATLLWSVVVGWALSFAISVVSVRYAPISAFYLLPSRFWELLTGSFLAVGGFHLPNNALLRNAVSVLGLAAIAFGVFALSANSSFPGFNALPPCLGTALLIHANTGTDGRAPWINAAFATKVPVAVGLISYSLYLWHWPIFVLANSVLPHGLGNMQTVIAITASFALAALSWRFVEQPFRGRTSRIARKPLFVMAAIAIAVFVIAGAAIGALHGLPQRYDIQTQKILAEAQDEPLRAQCFNMPTAKIAKGGLCKLGNAEGNPTFLLWGDSHADAIAPALDRAGRAQTKTGLVAAHGHCAPFTGTDLPDPSCRPFNDAVMKIALSKNIDTVLLDARWAGYAGVPSAEDEQFAETGAGALHPLNVAQSRAMFAASMKAVIAALTAAGKKVVIIGPVPEFAHSVPVDLAKMRVWHEQWEIAPTRSEFLARETFVNALFAGLAAQKGVTLVDLARVTCPDTRCATTQSGLPLYRDGNHLSVFGAEQLAPLFNGLL